ncbi:MAG: hypothetical protein GXO34_03020 [Deltaproteobacteria bacterium]|nr:hypothetical protein [Deltaproteobacteria bacterium]
MVADHYPELAVLLEREVEVLSLVADFYQQLAGELSSGRLPETARFLAVGAHASDNLGQLAKQKKDLLRRLGVDSLRRLLENDRPMKVRRLVSTRGREIVALQRVIMANAKSIHHSLEALQMVNQRFNDFFLQLCPATIAYRERGNMTENAALYSGVELDGVA